MNKAGHLGENHESELVNDIGPVDNKHCALYSERSNRQGQPICELDHIFYPHLTQVRRIKGRNLAVIVAKVFHVAPLKS